MNDKSFRPSSFNQSLLRVENRDAFIDELAKKLKSFQYKYEIRDYLNHKGIDPALHNEIYQEALARSINKNKGLRTVIFSILAMAVVVVMYFFIPASVYNLAPMVFSGLGALLLTIFMIQAVGDYRQWEDFANPPKDKVRPIGQRIAPFLIIPGIISIFIFQSNFRSAETRELKKYGARVIAMVADGTATTIKRSTTYTLTLRFKIEADGDTYSVKENVSESEYHSVGKGSKVEIIYSTRDPEILDILISDAAYEKYLGIKKTEIGLEHVFGFMELDKDALGRKLNEMSYRWEYDQENMVWINEKEDQGVQVYKGRRVMFISPSAGFLEYPEELKALGFEPQDNGEKRPDTFVSDEYSVKIDISGGSSPGSLLTVLTVNKR